MSLFGTLYAWELHGEINYFPHRGRGSISAHSLRGTDTRRPETGAAGSEHGGFKKHTTLRKQSQGLSKKKKKKISVFVVSGKDETNPLYQPKKNPPLSHISLSHPTLLSLSKHTALPHHPLAFSISQSFFSSATHLAASRNIELHTSAQKKPKEKKKKKNLPRNMELSKTPSHQTYAASRLVVALTLWL